MTMNEAIKAGEVFCLADLIDYRDGEIVHMDLAGNEHMKVAMKAFDAGKELAAHTAPGDVIVFALEGEAVINCDGKDHPIKAGENFHFAKGNTHAVKAKTKYKMAFVVVFD